MNILIIAATKNEIAPLLGKMTDVKDSGGAIIESNYKKHKITVVISGVGMIATTYYATKTISDYYELAINTGICGSFNKNLEIGSVVNVYEDCFAELGAEDGDSFLTLEEIGLKGIQKVESQKLKVKSDVIDKLPKVNGITVNKVHGNEKSIERVFNKFHPITESMEGAAFMFVCEKEKIPFIQIRSISNYVEKRNKYNWNIPLAIKNLNEKMIEILEQL